MALNYIISIDERESKNILRNIAAGTGAEKAVESISFGSAEMRPDPSGTAIFLNTHLDSEEGASGLAELRCLVEKKTGVPLKYVFTFSDSIPKGSLLSPMWQFFCESAGELSAWLSECSAEHAGDDRVLIYCATSLVKARLSEPNSLQQLKRSMHSFFGASFEPEFRLKEPSVSGQATVIQEMVIEQPKPDKSAVLTRDEIKGVLTQIEDITGEGRFIIEGRSFAQADNVRELRNKKGTFIVSFYVTNEKDTIKCICFVETGDALLDISDKMGNVRCAVEVAFDERDRELTAKVKKIFRLPATARKDNAAVKRIELHAHTKMSAMDGLMGPSQYLDAAYSWGMPAFAVTDHGVVHSFPEIYNGMIKKLKKKHPEAFEFEDNGKKKYRATDEAYRICIEEKGAPKIIFGMEGYLVEDKDARPPTKEEKENEEEKVKPWHIIILAKNKEGLKNLYKLVSASHLHYFYKKPRIPRSELLKHREGLVIGTACWLGELYQAFLNNEPAEKIRAISAMYDYFEIQPDTNNDFLVREGRLTQEKLHEINKSIVELGRAEGKPVVATCDAHFYEKHDRRYREFLMLAMGFNEAAAELYLRTTDEMLAEFAYLGEETAREVVITGPGKVASMIEGGMMPVPDRLNPPVIADADERVRKAVWDRALELYGENMHSDVKARIERELTAVIGNKYAVLYLIAKEMVHRSNKDGYIVGSRGSVGSSFAAYLCGITEVNPLKANYACKKCGYFEFVETDLAGVDLPEKNCPECGEKTLRDGYNIPFETFMGFKGDKVPDIDLNFSGEYQETIHKFVIEMFGEDKVFRAGTIGTLQENAVRKDFMNKYMEKAGITLKEAEKTRLAMGCRDVKRSTGQHPGGLMLVPEDRDIHEFTPVQFNKEKDGYTTHFDYHFIHDTLVKIDALGHELPTSFKYLCDALNVKFEDIPLDDKPTMQLFSSLKPLNVKPENYEVPVGTLGVPEYGTKFTREMLNSTKPKTFTELVYIAGLSHGTDVWRGNAEELIRNKTATLKEVISVRDDIMNYLIGKGLPKDVSFKITESVRKGNGLTPDFEKSMRQHKVPDWYIDSCKKIKYMFPKAHAVAYAMMSVRIAYIKVHHPAYFYSDYFNRSRSGFEFEFMGYDMEGVKRRIRESRMNKEPEKKEKDRLEVLEVLFEMRERNVSFAPVSIYDSHPVRFTVREGLVLPPITVIPQLGEKVALLIEQERKKGKFTSVEDLVRRTKVNKNVAEFMKVNGLIEGLPQSDQAVLF